MNRELHSENLSKLLLLSNGCQYTDLNDGIVDYPLLSKNRKLNILQSNIRSFLKNVDNLLLLLHELQEKGVIVHMIGVC